MFYFNGFVAAAAAFAVFSAGGSAFGADPIEAGYVETCSSGVKDRVAACTCAYPKVVAATEPDDVPFYVSAWAISMKDAAAIKAKHPEGWAEQATARYKAAEAAALAECKSQ